MIPLWHLLILICFVMPMSGALAAARIARVGFAGDFAAVILALLLGTACAWLMWVIHNSFCAYAQRRRERGGSVSGLCAALFYVTKLLWIIFACFLGERLSALLLRVLF